MDDLPEATRLELTGSYRFGPAVAEEANRWLERLESPLRLRGYRKLESVVTDEQPSEWPDCMIYRTNAGCIAGAMRGLEDGLSVAIVVAAGRSSGWRRQRRTCRPGGRRTTPS